jgi:hypothetical protein
MCSIYTFTELLVIVSVSPVAKAALQVTNRYFFRFDSLANIFAKN